MKRDLQRSINVIHQNLMFAWNYYYLLEALFEEAKADKAKIDAFPLFFTLVHRSLHESLFARIFQFLDKRHDTYSMWHLLQDVRQEHPLPDFQWIIDMVSKDEIQLDPESNPTIKRCRNWRHKIVAHLTDNIDNSEFYETNLLHLKDIETVLDNLEDMLKRYSDIAYGYSMGTSTSDVKGEVRQLFRSINL